MTVFVCIADNGTVSFFGKRQSRDSVLRRRVLEICGEGRLFMSAYSKGQFEEKTDIITVTDSFPEYSGEDGFYFSEITDPAEFEDKTDRYIIYRWNRNYPGNIRFTVPLEEHGWHIEESTDFEGTSHEKITEEIWTK